MGVLLDLRKLESWARLADPQVVGRLQRAAAAAANERGAVSAGQRVTNFLRALRAIKQGRARLACCGFNIRSLSHVGEECSIVRKRGANYVGVGADWQ